LFIVGTFIIAKILDIYGYFKNAPVPLF